MIRGFEALSKRTSVEVYKEENDLRRAMGVVLPILIYRFLDIFFVTLGAVIVKVSTQKGLLSVEFATNNSGVLTAIIKIISIIIACAAIWKSFKGEKPVFFAKESPKRWMLLSIMLGITAALFLNQIFYRAGFLGKSELFNEVAAKQYSLSLGLGIIVYGIMAPFAEELLYRGIVYNRLRRSFNIVYAFIFSSLVFGIMHGNLVQGIYGSILGFLIAWIYERYGAFIYPFLMHASANICIYLLMQTEDFRNVMMSGPSILLSGLSFIMVLLTCLLK